MARFSLSNLLIMLAFILPSQAMAGTPLSFDATPQPTYELLKTHTQSPITNTAAAQPDLNEDGVSELILRHACKDNSCEYSIFAIQPNDVLPLGSIKAREIQLSDKYTGSARNLVVFKENANDFLADEYFWDSETTQYQLKKVATP